MSSKYHFLCQIFWMPQYHLNTEYKTSSDPSRSSTPKWTKSKCRSIKVTKKKFTQPWDSENAHSQVSTEHLANFNFPKSENPHTVLLPHTVWLKMRKVEKFIFKHINESQKEQFHRNRTWSSILEKIHIKYYKFKIIDVVWKSFSYFLKSLFINTTSGTILLKISVIWIKISSDRRHWDLLVYDQSNSFNCIKAFE